MPGRWPARAAAPRSSLEAACASLLARDDAESRPCERSPLSDSIGFEGQDCTETKPLTTLGGDKMRETLTSAAAGAMISLEASRRRFLRVAAGAATLPVLSNIARAQNYPSRPVRLVVAFVPGGATDTLARQISNDLKEALGQAVVVENRPGANGYLAWNHVAAAEPDGHTLLLAENALAMSQALYKKAASSFDPLTQYDAVAGIATSPSALIISKNIPATTVAELVAYSRTVPGKMNFASAGVGSVAHLNFEVFKDAVGME